MAKKKSVTDQMIEEKKALLSEAMKIVTKGLTIKLTLEAHHLLTLVTDELGEKKGKFAAELLTRSLEVMAVEMGYGEPNFDTGEFILFTEEQLKKFKKEKK